MADINVERKGPSIWPWIIGLLVLALLIWAIAEMVSTDQEQVATETQAPPAAVPAPAPAPGAAGAENLSALMPLGPEDANRNVMVNGEVVGQPTSEGFWIRTPDNQVIFVQSTQPVTTGQNVSATGTLQNTPSNQASTRMSEANLSPESGWTVQRDMFVSSATVQTQPGAQQPGTQPDTMQGMQPGTQPRTQPVPPAGTPGDTVRGRY